MMKRSILISTGFGTLQAFLIYIFSSHFLAGLITRLLSKVNHLKVCWKHLVTTAKQMNLNQLRAGLIRKNQGWKLRLERIAREAVLLTWMISLRITSKEQKIKLQEA